jgi:hypothetical protein
MSGAHAGLIKMDTTETAQTESKHKHKKEEKKLTIFFFFLVIFSFVSGPVFSTDFSFIIADFLGRENIYPGLCVQHVTSTTVRIFRLPSPCLIVRRTSSVTHSLQPVRPIHRWGGKEKGCCVGPASYNVDLHGNGGGGAFFFSHLFDDL